MSKEKKAKEMKEMTTGRALMGFLIPIALLIGLLALGLDVSIATLIALFAMVIFCMAMNMPWERIDAAMAEGIKQISIGAIIMLLVGCMVAAWMASGTIPTLLYYGLKIIHPAVFLPVCFLLTVIMSVCTGTSWGSISTIGVVLCGMSEGLGLPLGVTAGAVISGAYVGDKMSPLSDCTLLGAATAEVDLFDHIKSMFYTMVPAGIICLVAYFFLGLRASGSIDTAAVANLSDGMKENFSISFLHLIPVIAVLVLSAKKVPSFLAFGVGIGLGVLWAIIFQGRGLTETLGFLMNGFYVDTPNEAVATLVNRGGFSSMLGLVGTMIVLGMLSGLLSETRVLNILVEKLSRKLSSPASILTGAWFSAGLIAVIGGQYPSLAISSVAFKDICDEKDIHRAVLSRTVSDIGVVLCLFIPWNVWTMGIGVVLGCTVYDFMPYVFFGMLCPVLSLIFNYTGIGLFRSSDDIKYKPFWRRRKESA